MEELSKVEQLSKKPNLSEENPLTIHCKKETFLQIQKIYKENVAEEKKYLALSITAKNCEIKIQQLRNDLSSALKGLKSAESGIHETNKELIQTIIDSASKGLTKAQKDVFESEVAMMHAIEKSIKLDVDIDFVNQQIIIPTPILGLGDKKE